MADVAASWHARIPADLSRVAELRSLVRSAVDAIDLETDDECQADLVQAVDEAATNTIVHGDRGTSGWVDVAVERVADRLVITVQDDAPTFDPTVVPEPDLSVPPDARRPGGMGIHLIRESTDALHHSPRSGGGNILTMTRRLDRRPKEKH